MFVDTEAPYVKSNISYSVLKTTLKTVSPKIEKKSKHHNIIIPTCQAILYDGLKYNENKKGG